MWVYGLDWAGPGQRQVAYAYECGNEPSGSVKCDEFLDYLQTRQLLMKDSAPWSKYGVSKEFKSSGLKALPCLRQFASSRALRCTMNLKVERLERGHG